MCVALASINERPEFTKPKKFQIKSNQILGGSKSTLDDAHCELCLKQSKVQVVVVVVVVVQCETMSAGPLAAAAGLVESVMSFWLEAGATTEELLRSVCRQNSFFPFSLIPTKRFSQVLSWLVCVVYSLVCVSRKKNCVCSIVVLIRRRQRSELDCFPN